MTVRIIQGDCIEELARLPEQSVDMVFTDPPYGHNNNNGDLISQWEAALGREDYVPERDNRPIANDGKEADDVFRQAMVEVARILKPGACCACCYCWESYARKGRGRRNDEC